MVKSQHTDFKEDTSNESASVAWTSIFDVHGVANPRIEDG